MKGEGNFMDAIKKLSVMATSSEENSGIRLLSNSLNAIYHAVLKCVRLKVLMLM